MMKRFYILFLLLVSAVVYSQDLHMTQFYATPLNLNPAFAGAGACNRIGLAYRNQWNAIGNGYVTNMLYYDHYLSNYNSGIGFHYIKDVAGTGALRKDNLSGFFAYEIALNRKYSARFGMQVGLQQNSIYYKDLLFGDQIVRGGEAVSTVELIPKSKLYLDASTGVLIYSAYSWLGFSVHHLNRPNESLVGGMSTLPVKFSVHGGGKTIHKSAEDVNSQAVQLNYAFNYKAQKEFDQLDLGLYVVKNNVNLGVWYRGIPFLKSYKAGYPNNDAVAFILGYSAKRFNVGYSYDLTISWLTFLSAGSHEVTMNYQLCDPKAKKKKKRVVISCPKF